MDGRLIFSILFLVFVSVVVCVSTDTVQLYLLRSGERGPYSGYALTYVFCFSLFFFITYVRTTRWLGMNEVVMIGNECHW